MKKKIMYITQSNGGVAKYLEMLFKYMDKSVYEQILIYPNEYIEEKDKFIKYVDNIEFVDMIRKIDPIADIISIYKIRKLIKKYNPDLIYVQSSKAGALGRIANIFIKKPIIYNAHGWAFNMKISNKKIFMYKFIERLLASMCDKIVAISEQEKKSAIENKICKEDKIKVIYNGIDIEEYKNSIIRKSDIKKELGIPLDSILIGMVGRISKQKAPDTFIRVAAKLREIIPNSFFIIVGDGEEKCELEQLIDELKLNDKVFITGWVSNTYKYIQAFDIGMLLSRWEGFGLVLAEYMICGVPIVATNVDAIPNLIEDNVNGILVDKDNIDQAVSACKKILSDKEFSEFIVKNSKEKVLKRFNIERVVKEHDKLFNSML